MEVEGWGVEWDSWEGEEWASVEDCTNNGAIEIIIITTRSCKAGEGACNYINGKIQTWQLFQP